MQRMTEDEWRRFLLEKPRTAKVAVVRADGRPHVTPTWIDMDGDRIVFTTHRDSLKGKALLRDPRLSLCVDDDWPPFSFVTVEGVATISEDLADLRHWAGRIGGRYMGADRADEYGARNGVPGELLIHVTIRRVSAYRDVAA
ncbi:MAG: PPOX class F420-dependent oxidoreductase [Chloroflexi bacterium]|nr:PPOX class F420-dependent oxidoreductase [Chloroflexota bacterium]